MSDETLAHFRNSLLRGLDRQHACLAGIDWAQPHDALIAELAPRLRDGLQVRELEPLLPEQPAGASLRIALQDESAGAMAERMARGGWISVGRRVDLPQGVDFTFTPDRAQQSGEPVYGEWTWQLNRHAEWVVLARLYLGTGDEAYAEQCCALLRRWLEQAPPPDFDSNSRKGTWRTIEIGIRLANSWSSVLTGLRHAAALDDHLLCAWLGAWAEQAYFVWQYRKDNNWLHMEMNGLAHAGLAMPFHRDAARWRRDAVHALVASLDDQEHPDGMQFELSTSYHCVCIRNYQMVMDGFRRVGEAVPDALIAGVAAMHEPLRRLRAPDGLCWNFQDSHGIRTATWLERLPAEQRGPHDDWFIDGRGEPPPDLHSVLDYAGYGVLRSSWSDDALCLAFDGGPYGAAHQHEDKLGFQLMAHGSLLIGEAGIVDYLDSPERRYSLRTEAHSTVLIDGQGQMRRLGFTRANIDLHAQSGLRHDLQAAQPWLAAEYADGYGEQRIPVRHWRCVSLLDAEHVLVLDRLVAEDGRAHRAEILFHLLIDEVEGDPAQRSIRTLGPQGNCALRSLRADGGELDCNLVVGGEEPDLRGWAMPLRDGRESRWQLAPKPCWTLSAAFDEQLCIATIIACAAPGSTANAPDLSWTADGLHIAAVPWQEPAALR